MHVNTLCYRLYISKFTVSNVLLWLCFRAVTFRQFVANLLYNLQRMPSLSSLYRELSDLVIRYDDCLLTCSIPFTRRRRRLGQSSPGGAAAERWRSLAADTDNTDGGGRMSVDVGLCEALAVTLFGSKLRCHRQKMRHVFITHDVKNRAISSSRSQRWNRVSGSRVTGSAIFARSGRVTGQGV